MTVKICDVSGALVRVLEDREREPGEYEVGWNVNDERGKRVSSGVYSAVLETAGVRQAKKIFCV